MTAIHAIGRSVRRWFDAKEPAEGKLDDRRVEWLRILPFILLHLGCGLVFLTGFSVTALVVCLAAYWARMFAITAFYHRYFSHRAFQTSRFMQFVFAFAGGTAAQRGPLWWAAHHRKHHKYSDTERDAHSPEQRGLLWAHMGWFTTEFGHWTDLAQVRDLAKFPELRFLDRFDWVAPLAFALGMFGLGELLGAYGFATTGWQIVAWGFFVSTVVLFHVTSLVNSMGHTVGSRRYETADDSRNNPVLAVLTMGEGWHNNHHHYPVAARQGFYWWEVDPTYYTLQAMAKLRLVRELREVPAEVRARSTR